MPFGIISNRKITYYTKFIDVKGMVYSYWRLLYQEAQELLAGTVHGWSLLQRYILHSSPPVSAKTTEDSLQNAVDPPHIVLFMLHLSKLFFNKTHLCKLHPRTMLSSEIVLYKFESEVAALHLKWEACHSGYDKIPFSWHIFITLQTMTSTTFPSTTSPSPSSPTFTFITIIHGFPTSNF